MTHPIDDKQSKAKSQPNSAQSRREALATVGKFAAFVAPATSVLLSADQAKAVPNCSNDPNGIKGQNCK